MCHLADSVRAEVDSTLKTFTKKGFKFTGRDIWLVVNTAMPIDRSLMPEVSAYVRELFNGGAEVFSDYACMKVYAEGLSNQERPLLYFRPEKRIRERAQLIGEFIKDSATLWDGVDDEKAKEEGEGEGEGA